MDKNQKPNENQLLYFWNTVIPSSSNTKPSRRLMAKYTTTQNDNRKAISGAFSKRNRLTGPLVETLAVVAMMTPFQCAFS